MSDITTRSRLLDVAIGLFAGGGFDGTSIRTITQAADANLGAVTYHFGSKAKLFEAALAEVVQPFRQRVGEIAREGGSPIDRIELIVRTFFEYFHTQPALPQLVIHVLATPHHMPDAVRVGLAANHLVLAGLIAEGQEQQQIRDGDPRLLALSIATQPVMLALMRRALSQTIGLDQEDDDTRRRVIESVVAFVRAGLEITPRPV